MLLGRCKTISKEIFINEEIRGKELRVIDQDGTQLGIMSREEALALADEKNLDLVNISPNAKPPVCKILDYGKYRFEQGKREKEARLGMKKQPIRAMVIGIPNVGKSTLINNISGRRAANVGNKAGVTRAEQWLKLNDDFTLLDTPGVLPMNYPDGAMAVRLAILGSMREDVLPTRDLAYALLGYMRENYPTILSSRFLIDDISMVDRPADKRAILIENIVIDVFAGFQKSRFVGLCPLGIAFERALVHSAEEAHRHDRIVLGISGKLLIADLARRIHLRFIFAEMVRSHAPENF